jgi:hypothetical protein
LAGAAAVLPVPPEAPSLWPALEQQIQAHEARSDARSSPAVLGVVEGRLRVWADLDGDQPLHSAWMRDSLREVMEMAGWYGGWVLRGAWSGGGREDSGSASQRGPGWVVGLSAAAAILAVVIGIPVAHRRAADAEATILANAAPREGWVIPQLPLPTERRATADPGADREPPARQLAQADPVPLPEPPAAGSDGAAASKAATPTRFGYDLQLGIPMPPDAREPKPVY